MRLIIKELEELKKLTDFMIDNKDITDKKDLEKILLNFEKIRYEILSKIKLNNKLEPIHPTIFLRLLLTLSKKNLSLLNYFLFILFISNTREKEII